MEKGVLVFRAEAIVWTRPAWLEGKAKAGVAVKCAGTGVDRPCRLRGVGYTGQRKMRLGLIGDGLLAMLRSLDVILLALASIGGLRHGRDMISTVF